LEELKSVQFIWPYVQTYLAV